MGVVENVVVDDLTFERLSKRAHANGKSLEEVAAEALVRGLDQMTGLEAIEQARRIRATTPKGVKQTDSTKIIRDSREHDH